MHFSFLSSVSANQFNHSISASIPIVKPVYEKHNSIQSPVCIAQDKKRGRTSGLHVTGMKTGALSAFATVAGRRFFCSGGTNGWYCQIGISGS
jgi:hypothetical protein